MSLIEEENTEEYVIVTRLKIIRDLQPFEFSQLAKHITQLIAKLVMTKISAGQQTNQTLNI